MKRGADRQISKDDDPDDEIEEVQTGFQMAKESDLARREIKGLPKRKNPLVQAAPPSVSSAAPVATQKFGYFSGFGAISGAKTPFTFAPSAPQDPAESSAPAVAESASNATKKFASFLGPSSTTGAKPAVSSDSPKPDASGDTDEVALKYYTSLRGLNTSFLSAVSKAMESDPFVDVVDLLEQYKKHRISVQHEYDGKSSSQSTSRNASKPVSSATPFSFGKSTTSTSATSSFAGFPAPSATANSAAPALGTGFTPSPAPSVAGSSPFKFPSAQPDTKPAPVASTSPFGAFTASPAFKPPVFLTPKEADSALPSKPAFSFGASASAGTASSASPFGSSSSNSSPPSSGTSLFGNPPKSSALFGPDKSSSSPSTVEGKEDSKPGSSAFGAAPFTLSIPPGTKLFGDTNTTTTTTSSGSIFGAKSTDKEKEKDNKAASPPSSVFGATTTFGSPAKPSSSSPFGGGGGGGGFGSATSTATPSPFVFGVAAGAGAEGTPSPKAGSVGFSFGSPSRASSQPAAAAAAPSSGFSFAPAPATTTPASTNPEAPSSTSRADTPATDATQEEVLARTLSPPGGEGDVEGEGEEDEETTYTVKAKVFKFTTDREGASTWAELGVGMLRLKKHKVTNARRIILRSTATGKIIINFRIYAGLQPKRTAKVVAFMGHITSPDKETQTVQYRLRVSSEAAATETAEAIEREVRLVQAEGSQST